MSEDNSISDEEALEWLNSHCMMIRLSNNEGLYTGSWNVNGDILEAARKARLRSLIKREDLL